VTGRPAGVSIVVPTVGRGSLGALIERLRPQLAAAPLPVQLLVMRDRRRAGPAATRNEGWRAARYEWVAFLDDDVLPAPDWFTVLLRDLHQPPEVGGVQGRIRVPRSDRPDDWEHNTTALADAAWATADMAYRRVALAAVGGFDERFPRAYREDADIAYRVRAAGWRLVLGARGVTHPVRPEGPWISLRTQRGNADDALLRRLYGPHWHRLLAAPVGRRRRHAVVTLVGLAALGLAGVAGARGIGDVAARRARLAGCVAGSLWSAGTAEFMVVRARQAPGSPRGALLVTSVLIPPLALAHWLRGWLRHRTARRHPSTQA
jgi:hypothetical protein